MNLYFAVRTRLRNSNISQLFLKCSVGAAYLSVISGQRSFAVSIPTNCGTVWKPIGYAQRLSSLLY